MKGQRLDARRVVPLKLRKCPTCQTITDFAMYGFSGAILTNTAPHKRAIAAAGVLFSLVDGLPVWFVTVPLALFGVGFGLLNDPVNVAAVSELPAARAASSTRKRSPCRSVSRLAASCASSNRFNIES